MKALFTLLILTMLGVNSIAQNGPIIGPATAIPAGTFACVQQSFPSPIGTQNDNPVTYCFTYQYVGPVNLSFLLVNGLCGPFPLYNTLSFSIYDSSNTTLIVNGSIIPTANNTYIDYLVPGTWYTFCYTWGPNCPQYSACPLIYTSLLPIQLLYFKGYYDIKLDCVVLSWGTATEKDVDYFIIQKAYDLDNFVDIATSDAAGNSVVTNNYLIVDCEELLTQTAYYKLIEVTVDGERIDQGTIALSKKVKIDNEIQIFDVTGRELKDFQIGVNIVRQGEVYYKVVKLN